MMKECRSTAYGLMKRESPYYRIKTTDLVLKGVFGVDRTLSGVLVPAAYLSYINRPGTAEIRVYNC